MTMPARTRSRIQDIFERVVELPPKERTAALQELCADDRSLQSRVERLLEALGQATGFLDADEQLVDTLADPAIPDAQTDAQTGEQPGDRIGPYELVGQLGEGGFGRVFEAWQEHPVRRRVAIKILKPGMDTDQVIARFGVERQALAMMEHPGIARMFDAGTTPAGRPYFVMEFVDGPRLIEYCDDRRLGLDARVRLMSSVCLAVHHAHQKAVIHRDLKPANVLVATVDGEPVPKVIDFGIARALADDHAERTLLTTQNQLIGTPEYMSPEQARLDGSGADIRSDVYALGVLLYELLTGSTPFDRQTLRSGGLAKLERVLADVDPPRPSSKIAAMPDPARIVAARDTDPGRLRGRLRGELDAIVMKCLAKDPDRRYPSADALGADLERFLANEPVEARAPSAMYRARTFIRRNRMGVAAGVTVFVAVALGLVGTTAGLLRAEELNDRLADTNETLQERNRDLDQALTDLRAETERVAAAQAKAVRERDAARAITDFFTDDLLLSAIPNRSGTSVSGRDVLLVDVLDEAAARIDEAGRDTGRFAGKPDVEAEVRTALSKTYRVLGALEQTAAHAKRAVDLWIDTRGESDERTLAAMHELGLLYLAQRRFADAEGWLRRAHVGRRDALGPDHEHTLVSMGSLAQAVHEQGRLAEGEELMHDLLPRAERTFGPSHFVTTTVRSDLAAGAYWRRDFQAAARLYREVVDAFTESLGPNHLYTLNASLSLCRPLCDLGKTDEALALLETTIGAFQQHFGPDYPAIAVGRDIRAQCLTTEGRFEEAEPELRELLRLYELRYEPEHQLVSYARGGLGQTLVRLGRHEEAESILRRAADSVRATPDSGTPIDYMIFRHLGHCLYEQQRFGEAASAFEEHVAAIERRDPVAPIDLARALDSLGAALAMAHDDGRAIDVLERSLELYQTAGHDRGSEVERVLQTVRARQSGPDDPDEDGRP